MSRVLEDSLIAERVEVIIQKSYVTLEIVGGNYPTISWHVRPLMEVKWMISVNKIPPGVNNPDNWFCSSHDVPSIPVQVILIVISLSRLPTKR